MEDIFNPVYRKEYFEGIAIGHNPLIEMTSFSSEAFYEGYKTGRQEYESLNGKISNGIPVLIVTTKVLEDFLLAGMLGMNIDESGYSPFQLEVIQKWYQSGVEKYDVRNHEYILRILEENDIELQ